MSLSYEFAKLIKSPDLPNPITALITNHLGDSSVITVLLVLIRVFSSFLNFETLSDMAFSIFDTLSCVHYLYREN
jgi:hypothetical protein